MNKPIYILGLNEAQGAAAALMRDGQIIAAAQEERFTRIKNQWGWPENAIQFCCDFAGIKPRDISLTVLSYADPYPHSVGHKAVERPGFLPVWLKYLRNTAPGLEYKFPFINKLTSYGRSIYYYFYEPRNQIRQTREISRALNMPSKNIIRINHHLCHAYSAYFANPQRSDQPTVAVTCDGAGDQLCAGIYLIKKNKFKLIAEIPHIHSLGLFYAAVTGFLGLKPHEDEYKVMGLAPYGADANLKKIIKIFRELIWVDDLQFRSMIPSRQYGLYLQKFLAGFRFDHIAAAAQIYLEEMLILWITNIITKTKINRMVFSGGIFLNVKANQKILNLKQIKQAFFMPSPGDDTNAFGACYYGYHYLNRSGKKPPKSVDHLYLGPAFSDLDIKQAIFPSRHKIIKPKNMAKAIAMLLVKNRIVARFSDRMEFGARALGNRSILANPGNRNTVEEINRMIKMRDFWMPFAGTIISEETNKYLVNPKKITAPFMILSFDTLPLARQQFAAAIHPYDKSIRPQILSEKDNPEYYRIIKEFKKISGIGGVLNTSFNLHGEPIVCTPRDAVSVFNRSGLRYLAIGKYLITKKTDRVSGNLPR